MGGLDSLLLIFSCLDSPFVIRQIETVMAQFRPKTAQACTAPKGKPTHQRTSLQPSLAGQAAVHPETKPG